MNSALVYKNTLSPEDYNALRKAVGWEPLCPEQARQGLAGSACVISCYDGGTIAASARVIWDGGYISYLADVMVMPEYQGKGIGRHLVEAAIAFMRSQLKEGWKIKMVLIAAKGKEPFYKKLGFTERPNESGGAGMELWLRSDV